MASHRTHLPGPLSGLGSSGAERQALEADIREELRSHLELATDNGIEAGLGAEQARRQAVERFGNFEQTVRDCSRQEIGGWPMGKRIHQLVTLALLIGCALLAKHVSGMQRQLTEAMELAAAPVHDPQEPSEIVVRLGDRIELFDTYRQLDGGGTYEVERDGTALLPALGHVAILGLTRANLEDRLRDLYKPYYDLLDLYARVHSGERSPAQASAFAPATAAVSAGRISNASPTMP